MAVAKLERELGLRLFDRSRRIPALTPEGQRLTEMAKPLLQDWDNIPTRLREAFTSDIRGPVRIGAGEAAVLYLLPEPIRRFRKRHPDVEVIVRNQPVSDTLDMLRAGELDAGLRSLPSSPADLYYRPWRTFDRVLIAPKGHPVLKTKRLTLTALADHPFVMPWLHSTTRGLLERAFQEHGLRYRVVVEAGGWEVIKHYVAFGLGIAVVSACCLRPEDTRRLGIRSLRHLFPRDAYGLVTKRGRHLSPATRELIRDIDPKFTPATS